MEEASLHTTRKHLFITTDKHGVPPTKRFAIWKNLGYSEWSTPAGLKLARENLQSRVKEEDSITNVENAVFDLGVMDSLCFHPLSDQRVFIGMITKFIKFVELNFPVITRGFDIKVAVRKAQSASSNLSDQEARFSPTVLSRILSNHDWIPQYCPPCFVDDSRGETMSDFVFKHDLWQIGHCKNGFRDHLMIAQGAQHLAK
ncbi:hypothetical protein Tco_1106602 [Tanacetum coccineum]